MDRLRFAFNNMVSLLGGFFERYSRFSLRPGPDGGQHVEVKLSDDTLDDMAEVDGPPAGDSPFYQRRTHSCRDVCYLALSALLVLLLGYLIGYVSHHKPPISCDTPGTNQSAVAPVVTAAVAAVVAAAVEPAVEPPMTWSNIRRLLSDKLELPALTQALSALDQESRSAGSPEDNHVSNLIYSHFQKLEMHPWTNLHYVQLQTQNSTNPNTIRFNNQTLQPKGYLAYSATGRVQGKVVYGHYGGPGDYSLLVEKKIEVNGSVMLLRESAKMSFAEQVAKAASMGAVAVLVYRDPQDYKYNSETDLYGHVHLGSGDPYTPGFPSFNHTQFPPTRSSGLPSIPAQTITSHMAATILRGFKGELSGATYRLGGATEATVEVNNVLTNTELHNVFGIIKGFIDPDRYVVIGAQRDSWCRGYARSTVGTAILMELAKAMFEMVEKDGFRPRRSIVFASWSAGEYGNVGATEWLEGYMSSLEQKAFAYISLDGVVMGKGSFVASASPLLQSLLKATMMQVRKRGAAQSKPEGDISSNKPRETDPAYPFLTFSGIPSLSFHITTKDRYPYYGTCLDNKDHLEYATNQHTPKTAIAAATLAGLMALRLVHDHVIPLDVSRYDTVVLLPVSQLGKRITQLKNSGKLNNVSATWLFVARGSLERATMNLKNDIEQTDFQNAEACRVLNDRIMAMEHCFLSPYVSPQVSPFRHILAGRGNHTLAAILEMEDMTQLRVQLALATWTLQSCANLMAGQIWEVDNEI
ncbi:unnamed protein product [Merluccius merluccius]